MLSKSSLEYLKFLRLAKAVNEEPSLPSLDAMEERLLNYLALDWHSDKKLTVVEIMHGFPDISPSTVHRRLKTMRKKGLIDLAVDEIDNRVKYIVHTNLTDKYFSHLGQCLAKSVTA